MLRRGRRLFSAEKPGTYLPEFREEPLVDCPHQVARTQRATGAARLRADDALDELDVLEPPLRKLLLVLQ